MDLLQSIDVCCGNLGDSEGAMRCYAESKAA